MKNIIRIEAFGKIVEKGHHNILGTYEIKIDQPVLVIKPEIILKNNMSISVNDIYGFNANISCEEQITLIVANFEYFTISAFQNAEPKISYLKVYNITEFCRFNDLQIRRMDSENSNILVVDCTITSINIGIETLHCKNLQSAGNNLFPIAFPPTNKILQALNTDIRNCTIRDLNFYVKGQQINIQRTQVSMINIQSTIERLHILDNSSVTKLYLGEEVNSLSINDSFLTAIKGSQRTKVNDYSCKYSTVENAYDIFDCNIQNTNEDSLLLKYLSYSNTRDGFQVSMIAYRLQKLRSADVSSFFDRVFLSILDITCGYGYKPLRAVFFAFSAIFSSQLVIALFHS